MLMLGLKSPPHRGLLKLQPMRTLWPTPPLRKSSPSLHRLPPATFHWLQDIGEDMCDVRGLGTSEKRERIYSLDSAFPIFNLLFSFCFSSAKWADVGGGGYLALVLFSFSRFTRHGADDDDYSYYYSNYQYINYCYLHSQYICWAPARASSSNLL